MLRVLRIAGIVVFGLLIGLSAHDLKSMHESGELFETYNSRRRAELALLSGCIIGVAALSFFELRRIRRLGQRYAFGERSYQDSSDPDRREFGAGDIYSSSKSVEIWNGRKSRPPGSRPSRRHTSRSRMGKKVQSDGIGFWMGLLSLICLILPFIYGGLLAYSIISGGEDALLSALARGVFSVMLLLSVTVLIGILKKAAWGMMAGCLLAICNLLIFPYGTALGLFLIVGLVGSSQHFAVAEKKRSRAKSASRSRAATA